ncbi:erythropoietin receptor isoform X2 [Elgaria multicarinata webbii]|uniref:erythropoietin receptor isoform X2 n=1 Tax=Elgaria multicarinata webbii TaxID=159646 RepID=UPI002FCCF0D7
MKHHRRPLAAFLALALWASSSSQGGTGNLGTHFNSKAEHLLTEEPLNPKCFTQQLEDLTCFWETSETPMEGNNQSTYSFRYKFGQDISSFIPLEIKVFDGRSSNSTLYTRTIYVEKLVFLDPPSNLTVQVMDSPGKVNVSWLHPPLAHLDNSLHYELAIFPEGYKAPQVEAVNGRTYLIINLKSGTHYRLAVRAKTNGVSYDGYWSAWSQAVSVVMPHDVDPLIVTFSVILVLIILLLAFITLMSNRRFLKKKIWPAIPTPEHEFKDLFTIYKGNFQLWLGHQSAYLWWSQNPPYLEEQPFLVEILSECDGRKVDGPPPPPPPLPPKVRSGVEQLPTTAELSQDDYLVLDEGLVPCYSRGDGSLLLPNSEGSEGTGPALAGGAGTPEPSQTSSSFEYTVFDPSSESLSPRGPKAEAQLKSSYQMVSDSGISADYSLVDSSAGQAGLYTNLCDGGGLQPFLPTYIVCS